MSGGLSSSPWRQPYSALVSPASWRSAPAARRGVPRTTAARVLQSCGSSSRATALGWSSTSAIAWIVAFVTLRQLGRGRRRPGGHLVRRVEQRVVVDAAVDETDPLGLGAVEHLAEHHRGHRRLRPGDAPEHPRVPAAGVQPDLQEPGVEAGPPRGQPHVAAEGEVHPGTDGGAVDGGQRRQRAAGDPQEPLVDAAEAGAVGRRQVAEVGAGAERRRRAGDDHGGRRTRRPRRRPSRRRSR